MSEKKYEEVKFKTLDGLYLSGWLYKAARKGPACIVTPGYNCIKGDFYPGFCEELQKAGITTLIYDPRNTGRSGGFPRNHIEPFKQVEDYSDAFIYMSTLDIVDSAAIFFWGVSFAGSVVLSAAAIDKRVAGVIAVAPIMKYGYVDESDAIKLVNKVVRDRESQLLHGNPPYYVATIESRGMVPQNSHIDVNKEEEEVPEDGLTHNRDGAAIQSYYSLMLWQPVPMGMLHLVNPCPVFFLTPEFDYISPTQQQLDMFKDLKGPKKLHLAKGREHVNVLFGPDMPMLAKIQSDWVWQVVKGRYKSKTNGAEKPVEEVKLGTWGGKAVA